MPRLRRRSRRPRPPVVVPGDGEGHLIGLELEAKLLGRIRLLTVEATAAISDGSGLVLDVAPRTESHPARALRPLPAPPRRLPGADREGLADAATMVREARELLPGNGAAARR